MNMRELVNSLSNETFQQLASAVYDRRRRESRNEAAQIILSDAEIEFIKNGKPVNAVKSVRDRIGCSLMVAKDATDMYSETSVPESLNS
jgi:ribosomal protein L7/L12